MLQYVREHLWHLETWLVDGDDVRRVGTREVLTREAFEKQKSRQVSYAVFKQNHGTYSDGKGDTPPAYERIE